MKRFLTFFILEFNICLHIW